MSAENIPNQPDDSPANGDCRPAPCSADLSDEQIKLAENLGSFLWESSTLRHGLFTPPEFSRMVKGRIKQYFYEQNQKHTDAQHSVMRESNLKIMETTIEKIKLEPRTHEPFIIQFIEGSEGEEIQLYREDVDAEICLNKSDIPVLIEVLEGFI